MLKISRLTDYGIVILRLLALKSSRGDQVFSARDLAHESGLPLPTVSKLLKILANGEVIEARRGAHGGYLFTGDPSKISLLSLLELFEGKTAITSCTLDFVHSCSIETRCPQKNIWQMVNDKFAELLSNISLFDLISNQTSLVKLRTKEIAVHG